MKTLIHIGANKTASTTLQRCLFAAHPSIHYVGEDGPTYAENKDIFSSLLWTDDLFWDRAKAETYFRAEKKRASGKKLVFSSEDIMTSHIASQCLRRLRELLGSARILLVIRSQLPAICSYYSSHGAFLRPAPYTHYKRYVPLEDWLTYNYELNEFGPLAGYDYWRFVTFCEDLFGKGSVKILLFEDLVAKPDHFFKELSGLLGIGSSEVADLLENAYERTGMSARAFLYQKLLSHLPFNIPISKVDFGKALLREKFQKYLNEGPKKSIELGAEWTGRLSKKYAGGNLKLMEKYKLPLDEYNYPLG